MSKSNIIAILIRDEGGDLIQNIIWIFGGLLTGVAATSTLFTSVKTKLTAIGTSVTGITTP